jgi:small-conductance mechanosensitive channel
VTDLSDILVIPSRIRQGILDELAAADITVPFPQRDVRIITPPETPLPEPR